MTFWGLPDSNRMMNKIVLTFKLDRKNRKLALSAIICIPINFMHYSNVMVVYESVY